MDCILWSALTSMGNDTDWARTNSFCLPNSNSDGSVIGWELQFWRWWGFDLKINAAIFPEKEFRKRTHIYPEKLDQWFSIWQLKCSLFNTFIQIIWRSFKSDAGENFWIRFEKPTFIYQKVWTFRPTAFFQCHGSYSASACICWLFATGKMQLLINCGVFENFENPNSHKNRQLDGRVQPLQYSSSICPHVWGFDNRSKFSRFQVLDGSTVTRDFISATLVFPKTKAILAWFVSTERPRRKSTEQKTSWGLSPNICSSIWSNGVSKKQREIVSWPSIGSQSATIWTFGEVHLTMAHPSAGPKDAKYPSVKAGNERCTVRLNRLGPKRKWRNLKRCAA